MKSSGKLTVVLVIMTASSLFFFANSAKSQAKPWNVPAADKAMKAPIKLTDPTVISNGKDLWAKHCKSCHGAKGLGDGPKSAMLKTTVASFTDAAFKAQTDGEIFFKTSKGRDEMPAYDKKIPEANDRWALVAFMRSLK